MPFPPLPFEVLLGAEGLPVAPAVCLLLALANRRRLARVMASESAPGVDLGGGGTEPLDRGSKAKATSGASLKASIAASIGKGVPDVKTLPRVSCATKTQSVLSASTIWLKVTGCCPGESERIMCPKKREIIQSSTTKVAMPAIWKARARRCMQVRT